MKLTVWEKHQKKIAEDVLRMPDAMQFMGGPSKKEAQEFLDKLAKKYKTKS
jgi:hypothetical protein